MKIRMISCALFVLAAAAAAFARTTVTAKEPARCALRLKQCVVFWKEGGRDFMGSGTLPCGEAEAYVARRNEEMGEGTNWFRPVWVNTDIDLGRDCATPEEIERDKKGVPWKDAVPANSKTPKP